MGFIEDQLRSAALAEFSVPLKKELLERGGLVILDGLDEIPDATGQRKTLQLAITEFLSTFNRCRYVVTSRTLAYRQQGWHLFGFEEAVLDDFDFFQVSAFVRSWYAEIARPRDISGLDAAGRASQLLSAIRSNSRIEELSKRPLLLTLMASLHAYRGGSLPEKREELYSDAVELLLDTWERQRLQRIPDGTFAVMQPSLIEWLNCDRGMVRELLNRLAFQAHAKSPSDGSETADIAERELVAGLSELSSNRDVRPRRLIEYLSERSGILVQTAPGVYSFPHRTLQEYLAACYLTDNGYPEAVVDLFAEDPIRWREVALLALAKAARGTAIAGVLMVQAAIPISVPSMCIEHSIKDHLGAWLAGRAILEVELLKSQPDRIKPMLKQVFDWLIAAATHDRLSADQRIEVGAVLSQLGDPRDELLGLDKAKLCWVPAGPFLSAASDREGASIDRVEADFTETEIRYDYWISTYPVTVAQYRKFIEAGGYDRPEYWIEAAALGIWRPGALKTGGSEQLVEGSDAVSRHNALMGSLFDLVEFPLEVSAMSTAQTDISSDYVDEGEGEGEETGQDPWQGADRLSQINDLTAQNQPAKDLTWFESLAFCRWLSAAFPEDVVVLPCSALEWEKASRGGLRVPVIPMLASLVSIRDGFTPPECDFMENSEPHRSYPWGYDLDEMKCFSDISGTACSVGLMPGGASPYGVEDMLSVWQHTRTVYADLTRFVVPGGGQWVGSDVLKIDHCVAASPIEEFVCGIRFVVLPRAVSRPQ